MTDSATDIEVRLRAGERATAGSQWGFVGWSPQPSAVGPVPHQPGFLINGSYCVSGGQLASITLNPCVTDTCGGISSTPATSYKCLL